jgi:7-carboxy-7-deazaguanine synthase
MQRMEKLRTYGIRQTGPKNPAGSVLPSVSALLRRKKFPKSPAIPKNFNPALEKAPPIQVFHFVPLCSAKNFFSRSKTLFASGQAAYVDARMSDTLVVNEIYLSLQGESTFAGLPCIFIRLTACNLRCSYCDTAYAFTEGSKKTFGEILERVTTLTAPYKKAQGLPLIEFTGGEPLLQPNAPKLMKALCDEGYTVLVETSGALDISAVDARVRRIMDLKCPSSGEVERNRFENIQHLKATDEVKFVIGTAEDYEWAKQQLARFNLAAICPVLFSWVSPLQEHQRVAALKSVPPGQTAITRKELVERIVADALPVRFQLQMHKFIWPPDERGV